MERLPGGRVLKYRWSHADRPLAYSEVIDLLQNDRPFCAAFNQALADSEFAAFRWETPAVTRASVGRPFEFVLLQCDALERPVDRQAFAAQFRDSKGSDVATFENLGRDATLVVPCPVAHDSCYGHLASFVRRAPQEQRIHLWNAVGAAIKARLGDAPVWLSTAGMGESWLHIRLDSRPKYYGYTAYKVE